MKRIVATSNVSFSSIRKAFDKTSTGFSGKDDFINAIYPYKDEIGIIRYMTPDTYYRYASRVVGHTINEESILRSTGSAGNSVKDLEDAILKGDILPMPYIDTVSGGAEGYHRMMAVRELTDQYDLGFVEVPVLVISRINLAERQIIPTDIFYDKLTYIGTRDPRLLNEDVVKLLEPFDIINREIKACWLLDPTLRQHIMAAVNTRNLAENLVRTKSSNVWAYGINVKDKKKSIGDVLVQFKGLKGGPADIYMYYDVPITIYRKLVTSPSKGHAIWKYLRDNFQYSKLTGDKRGKLRNAIN